MGNREARDSDYHAEQVAIQDAYAREFSYTAANRSWWDALWDGVNRMPRPLMALGTIGLFVYAIVSPPGFKEAMIALQAVPQPLWWLLGGVVMFYFGGRLAEKMAPSAPKLSDLGRAPGVPSPARKPVDTGNATIDKFNHDAFRGD